MTTSTALARTLVDELTLAGVRHACIAPGSRSSPLALACGGHPDIATHVVIDERSASFLALGIAKATRTPAVVVTTSGTAAANLHPAIAEADSERVPMIALTADRPPELRGTGANQTIDQIKLFGAAVRFFADVGAPGGEPDPGRYWRSVAARAVGEATGSPPGPVHLNLALRDPLVSDDAALPRRAGGPWTRRSEGPHVLSDAESEGLAGSLARARGVVLAGATDADPAPVLALAERLGWPVFAEPGSGMRRGPHAISTYEALLRSEEFARAHEPDVILRVGRVGLSRALGRWLDRPCEQILLDPDGAVLDPQRSTSWVVRVDPAAQCAGLLKMVPPAADRTWSRAWSSAEAAARAAIDALLDDTNDPTEPRAARDLAAALPEGSTLVAGSSMPVRDLDSFMVPRTGLRVLGNRGANGIDGFVSTALGIALATPAPTAALCGDLTLLHDQNGLLFARSEEVACTFVVLNNDGGGIFSFLEQAARPEHFERLFGTPHGVDFARLAEVYGCEHTLVEKASELGPAVERYLGHQGIAIVEVRTERAANVDLHRSLWAAVRKAVAP